MVSLLGDEQPRLLKKSLADPKVKAAVRAAGRACPMGGRAGLWAGGQVQVTSLCRCDTAVVW